MKTRMSSTILLLTKSQKIQNIQQSKEDQLERSKRRTFFLCKTFTKKNGVEYKPESLPFFK